MIEQIRQMGVLIGDFTSPGQTKADDVYPGHPNGVQVSRDRWLLVSNTRGYRFDDDERSIVYQLRRGAPDGPVVTEGVLARGRDGWDPLGDGSDWFRMHGHPVVFGVPKGALIGGRVPPHANLFAVKWRAVGIRIQARGARPIRNPGAMVVEWIQCRLNDREDDLEIVQPVTPLRQRGFEEGDAFCRFPGGERVRWMNQSFVQAVPYNGPCTEWIDVNHFDGGRIAAFKHAYDPSDGRYHWVQTGPLAGGGNDLLFEAGVVNVDGTWLIAARRKNMGPDGRTDMGAREGVAWIRTEDPFAHMPAPVYADHPPAYAPLTIYRAADGALRLFTPLARGDTFRMWDLDPKVSGPRGIRTPLRCWDIDPGDLSASDERIVFDSYDFGLPIRKESNPTIDMCKLLPHAGGSEQYVVHRVRPDSLNVPCTNVLVNEQEKTCAGIYYEKIVYPRSYPGVWTFA